MGTRNLTIVYKNGEYKVAQYGQWDGYPEGLGTYLLNFLKKINIDAFKDAIDAVSFFTKEKAEELHQYINAIKSIPDCNWQKQYSYLLPDTGGEILNLILFKGCKKVENSITFAADSLFCEWAYVVDLDTNKYEVYQGNNKEPLKESDRFYWLERYSENGYHPVKLIKSYDMDNLPEDEEFIKEFSLDRDEEG